MKQEKWLSKLVVDSFELKRSLSFWFEEEQIKLKKGAVGVSSSDWVYGKRSVAEEEKSFRFAYYLLTGKAVVLFIQSDDLWLCGDIEQWLIGGLQLKFGSEGESSVLHLDQTKNNCLDCGKNLTYFGWFYEDYYRGYKKAFVEGLIDDYMNLWGDLP